MALYPADKIGIVHGPSFATLNHFIITVHGKGGHGALPHQTIDPIIVGCNIVMLFKPLSAEGLMPLNLQ